MKFKPLFKERIWGGRKLEKCFGKKLPGNGPIGESWEISGVQGDISVVANGRLAGNSLQELVEVYMGDLVGEKVFDRFGEEFPLLIKLIDAADVLSIQVHPDDELAAKRHNAYGKTEMWYVIDCEKGAKLYVGFNRETDREEYLRHLENGTLADLLGAFEVKPGDAYFIPAGTIHAIGKGNLIAEIQQTSDITYRVFDWNRKDAQGRSRELHTELALDAIDFTSRHDYDITVIPQPDQAVQMQSCPYFTSAVLEVETALERDLAAIDSFVIYICLEGNVELVWEEGTETLKKGETVLVPAVIDSLEWKGKGKLIEVYVP